MKVLYLEDNPTDATRIMGLLKKESDEENIVWVKTVAEAESKEGNFFPDVILTDLNVPDSEGEETYQQLQKILPETPIVILTSTYEEKNLGLAAIRKGVQDFLEKQPLDSEKLHRSLRYAVERGKIQRELDATIQTLNKTIEELVRSNSNLERFAYLTSHDLQEPLRAVTSYSQLMELEYGDKMEDGARDYLQHIHEGAKRMQELVRDVLAYSTIGNLQQRLEEVDLNEIMERVIKNLKIAINANNALVKVDPLPKCKANKTEMMQLFQNLVGNGIKFCNQDSPVVRVSCEEKKPEEWLFSVHDNGIGIEPQYHDKIFEAFQRVHSRHEFPGTGIGLAICKKVVENHGGRLWLESSVGQGSTFYFTLPKPK